MNKRVPFFGTGSIIRDNCATESTTLTNYTNRMSMNLFNSTLDSSRIRNGVVSLMLNEMNNGASSYFPSAHMAPPTPPLPPQGQPVVVVQPPAQYITVNSDMPFRGRSYQPYHADRFIPSKSIFTTNTFNFSEEKKCLNEW